MNIFSVIVGICVMGVCFGLMVWGQKYLGEEQGRNPKSTEKTDDTKSEGHACVGCGSCASLNFQYEKTPAKNKKLLKNK